MEPEFKIVLYEFTLSNRRKLLSPSTHFTSHKNRTFENCRFNFIVAPNEVTGGVCFCVIFRNNSIMKLLTLWYQQKAVQRTANGRRKYEQSSYLDVFLTSFPVSDAELAINKCEGTK